MTSCTREGFSRALDAASGRERAALLEHARACLRCRAELVAADPSRLFALLSARPVPVPVLDAVSCDVSRAIREPASAGSGAHGATRAVAWAAALLLAILSGSLLFLPLRGPVPDRAGSSRVEVLSSPGAASVVDVTVGETQLVMIFDEDMKL